MMVVRIRVEQWPGCVHVKVQSVTDWLIGFAGQTIIARTEKHGTPIII